jgi:hypothetical protein
MDQALLGQNESCKNLNERVAWVDRRSILPGHTNQHLGDWGQKGQMRYKNTTHF